MALLPCLTFCLTAQVETPLYMAARMGRLPVVTLLLLAVPGMEVDKVSTRLSRTPLYAAAFHGKVVFH